MGFVVLAVGGLLSLLGAYEIYYGNSVIAVERGWSAFIGGSVLFAGGVVTAALGLVLHVLIDLRRLLPARLGTAAEPADPVLPIARDVPAPAREEPELSAFAAPAAIAVVPATDGAPRETDHASPVAPVLAEPVLTEPILDEPVSAERVRVSSPEHEPAEVEGPGGSHGLAHPAPEPREEGADLPPVLAVPQHVEAQPPLDVDFVEPAHHGGEAPPHETAPPAPEEPAAAKPEAPASPVIGRYESEGTSYVMYADGSIDAQSSAGVYRFASMAELKAFIEG